MIVKITDNYTDKHTYDLVVTKLNKATVYKLYFSNDSSLEYPNEKILELIDNGEYFKFYFLKDSIRTHLTNELALSYGLIVEMRVVLDYIDKMVHTKFRYSTNENLQKM